MNVIYFLDGALPSWVGGGPFRIVDTLINHFENKKSASPYIFSKYGLHTVSQYSLIKNNNKFKKPINYLYARLYDKLKDAFFELKNDEKKESKLMYIYHDRWKRTMRKIKLLDGIKPKIIHSFLNGGVYLVKNHTNKDLTKLISSYHSKGSIINDYKSSWNLDPQSDFAKFLYEREAYEIINSDIITFPSNAALELMKNDHPEIDFNQKDIRIIYNGINDEVIEYIKNKTNGRKKSLFNILTVASLEPIKNIDVILKALAIIKDEFNFKFNIIGSGNQEEKLRMLTKELTITDRVTFWGSREPDFVYEMMQNAHLFVLLGSNVIFDLVVLEAMASNLPLVLSNNGGNLEAIQNGKEGTLIDIDPLILAKTIMQIKENYQYYQILADNAYKKFKSKFTAREMCKNYFSIYKEIT